MSIQRVGTWFLGVMAWALTTCMGVCQVPAENVSIASARLVARGFKNVESLKDNKTEAGFVTYVELTSIPVPFDADILKELKALYKPGAHVDGPLLPPMSAVVLFDEARKPALLLWIFDGGKIGVGRLFEVDDNCYQGVRNDAEACSFKDNDFAGRLIKFVETHQKLPVDIVEWKEGKKR